jgi:hypothetical protein
MNPDRVAIAIWGTGARGPGRSALPHVAGAPGCYGQCEESEEPEEDESEDRDQQSQRRVDNADQVGKAN